ncbi:MAG: hypothetical protein J6C85_07700, partial [Alphaproteobacteria bacterium]|nr:hypothetical protein [Alphaproteobacteria bacterium]
MAEIEVPDFKSIDDFVKWSEGLSEKAIQSWKTDDWLKMYEKIDAYVESDDFYKFYKKAEKRLFDKGKLKTYDPTGAVDIAKRKHLFTNVCSEYIGKIYRNYRFEPEQSKYIREIAKQDGEKLATIQFDAAALAISDSDEAIINKGQTIGNITREGTHYGTTLETGFIDTSFRIDRSSSGAGATPVGRGVGIVQLNPETFVDGNVSVAFHEYAHIYKQARNPLQKELAEKGILAHPELGKNFHKLMEKNGEYYISGKMIQSLIDDLRFKGFPRNKCRVIFNNYHKQPSERYSNLYGAEAERSFRRVSGQLTERGAMDVSSFLGNTVIFQGLDKPPVMLGKPKEAASVEKGICLTYSASDKGVAAEDLLKGVEQRFAGMDEGLKKQLKIQKNMFGDVKITVPNDYSFRQGFLKFRSTPPPLLGIPPLPNGNAEVKIPSVMKEKAAASVGMQAAAPFEMKAALENSVSAEAKHLEEKVAAKAGTAAVVNGGEAAGKTTAKKSKVLAKAAAANAKFDKAVDKVIEKGAKKLNNSKVGKAYDKAASKVGNTKAG